MLLLAVCFLLIRTNASCRATLRCYLVCLCTMAFLYKPYMTGDLFRIYETMDSFAQLDFVYFWNHHVASSSVPVARLLYWGMAKTGINQLLPVFTAFFCYSVFFYIISRTAELFHISKRNVASVLFFVMTTSIYISVIGGIRMMLALSLITFAFFKETVEKRWHLLDLLLYGIAVLTHAMSFVVVGICVVVVLTDSERSILRKIGFALAVGAVGIAFLAKFNDIAQALFQKFFYYISEEEYYDLWEYVMGGLILVLLFVMMNEYRHLENKERFAAGKAFHAVTIWSMAIAICFCFDFSIFYRFGGQLAVVFAIPAMMVTLEETSVKPCRAVHILDFQSVLTLFSVLIAVISCTRGSLSSLKFFEL